jgi:hypothetical protein
MHGSTLTVIDTVRQNHVVPVHFQSTGKLNNVGIVAKLVGLGRQYEFSRQPLESMRCFGSYGKKSVRIVMSEACIIILASTRWPVEVAHAQQFIVAKGDHECIGPMKVRLATAFILESTVIVVDHLHEAPRVLLVINVYYSHRISPGQRLKGSSLEQNHRGVRSPAQNMKLSKLTRWFVHCTARTSDVINAMLRPQQKLAVSEAATVAVHLSAVQSILISMITCLSQPKSFPSLKLTQT